MRRLSFVIIFLLGPLLRADPDILSVPGKWLSFATIRSIPANLHLEDGTVLTGVVTESRFDYRPTLYIVPMAYLMSLDPKMAFTAPFTAAMGASIFATSQGMYFLMPPRLQFVEGDPHLGVLLDQSRFVHDPEQNPEKRNLEISEGTRKQLVGLLYGRRQLQKEKQNWNSLVPVSVDLTEGEDGHELKTVTLRNPADGSETPHSAHEIKPAFDCLYWLRRAALLPVMQ